MKGKEKLRNYCRQREAQEKWILLHAVRGSKSDPGTEKRTLVKTGEVQIRTVIFLIISY